MALLIPNTGGLTGVELGEEPARRAAEIAFSDEVLRSSATATCTTLDDHSLPTARSDQTKTAAAAPHQYLTTPDHATSARKNPGGAR